MLGDAHENDINLLVLLISGFLFFWVASQGFEYHVGLEIKENMVVAEVTEFGKIENGWRLLIFEELIIIVIFDFNDTLSNEVHFFYVTFVADNNSSLVVESAIHIDD